jgi:hypothetical protein
LNNARTTSQCHRIRLTTTVSRTQRKTKRATLRGTCLTRVCALECNETKAETDPGCVASPRSRFALLCFGSSVSDADREMNNPTESSNKKKRANPQATSDAAADEAVEGGDGAAAAGGGASNGASSASSSNFRNVSACNRCRLRKNRCDQKLPACTSCEKANVKYVCCQRIAMGVSTYQLSDVSASILSANGKYQEGEIPRLRRRMTFY